MWAKLSDVKGSDLRAARLVAGLSAREVADAVGVCARSIERAENRSGVRESTYQRQLLAVRRVLVDRLAALDRLLT
jgi:transcriptional regulator with XRE-family HTH domain